MQCPFSIVLKGEIIMSFEYTKAVLRLFKAVPVLMPSHAVIDYKETIKNGFVLTEDAVKNNGEVVESEIMEFITDNFGYNLLALNNGFHKSFKKVKETPEVVLILEQLAHYATVYLQNGDMFDNSKIDSSLVYVPAEKLNLPTGNDPVRLTVICSIPDVELEERVRKMLSSGMALSSETMDDLMTVIKQLRLEIAVEKVRNKEMRIRLYDALGTVPVDAEEFLRYLVFKTAGTTLLVRNAETIQMIKTGLYRFDVEKAFRTYVGAYSGGGIRALARVFLRHKNKALFLAFKGASPYVAHILNRVRKIADKEKKPARIGVLDRVTCDSMLRLDELYRELSRVTLYKKVTAANALLFQMANPDAALYHIRNGKAFATKRDVEGPYSPKRKTIFDIIVSSIVDDVRPAVAGKKIFIPEGVEYAMPTSEKRFIGGIPFNTAVRLGKDVVLGVHWENLENERVDLDLYYKSGKYDVGWNTNFTDARHKNAIYFSGDKTDAPKEKGGATEAYFVSKAVKDDFALVNMAWYTWDCSGEVPFKFVLGNADPEQLSKDYLLSCQNLFVNVPNAIAKPQQFLGFLEADEDGNKTFWFANAQLGQDIVCSYDDKSKLALKAAHASFASSLRLKDILRQAGAVFEKEEDEEWDIDLSLDKVSKDTFISLFSA